jgi:hypothetical protein
VLPSVCDHASKSKKKFDDMADLVGIRERLEIIGCGPRCPNDVDGRGICDATCCKRMLDMQKNASLSGNFAQRRPSTKTACSGKDASKSEERRRRGNQLFEKGGDELVHLIGRIHLIGLIFGL